MKKKPDAQPPRFPQEREEFAGELTPGLYPGPITRAHPGRFRYQDAAKNAPQPRPDDPGIWTPED